MNALARVFQRKYCGRCQQEKAVENFISTSAYCRPCRNEYGRDRMRQIRAGTWEPKGRHEYRRQSGGREIVVPIETASLTGVQASAETLLRLAMDAFLREHGFTRLRSAVVRIENEIAKTKRIECAREGWIV